MISKFIRELVPALEWCRKNKKRLIVFFTLVLVLSFFLPAVQRNPASDNALKGLKVTTTQKPFARQYSLGLLYEQAGQWADALHHYEAAAKADQDVIQAAAASAIRRTLAKQTRQRRGLFPWKSLALWLSLLTFLAVIFFRPEIIRLLQRCSRRSGYSLQPVQDFTGDKQGRNFHILLYLRSQEAREAQQQAQELLEAQSLAAGLFPALTTGQATAQWLQPLQDSKSKFSVAGINLPLQSLVQLIYKLINNFLPLREHTVSGQLHLDGPSLHLRVEIRNNAKKQVKGWDIYGDPALEPARQPAAMIDEWLYRVLLRPSVQDNGITSWRSLAAYMQGVICWRRYQEDGHHDPELLAEAVKLFQRAQEADPMFTSARFALGAIYNTQGQYAAAEDIFRALLEETNDDEDRLPLRYNLAVSLYHQVGKGPGPRENAEKQLDKILKQVEQKSDSQSLLLQSLANSGQALIKALEIGAAKPPPTKETTGKKAFALLEDARRVAGQLEKDTAELTTALAAADHAEGFLWLKLGEKEKARGPLKKAVKGQPSYAVPYINLAETYNKGDSEAILWLQRAVAIQPGFAFGWFRLGQAYDLQALKNPARLQQAREAFAKATGFADAQDRLGTIAFKEGDYEGAMAHYRKGIRLNSQKEKIWRNMAWRTLQAMETGLTEKQSKRLQDALSWAAQSVALAKGLPQEWRAYDTRGWAWLMLGELQKAENDFQRALDLAEKAQAQVYYHVALVKKLEGKPEEAVSSLEQARKAGGSAKWQDKINQLQNELK